MVLATEVLIVYVESKFLCLVRRFYTNPYTNHSQDYFLQLRESHQYDNRNLADVIAMLAIYMPIVREAAMGYKDLWNIHKIRKQPNRPNAVSGQPQLLYDDPPTGEYGSYGVPIDPEFAKTIEDSMEEWGESLFSSPQLC